MQVFKTYFRILKKQLLPVIIYGVMFLGLTIMISTNIKVENTQFEASKVNIMVVNEDGENEFLNGFLEYLSNYVTYVDVKEDEEARKDALFHRKVEYILTIPEDFTEKFIRDGESTLIKEAVPDSVDAISVDNAINNFMNMAKVYLSHVPGISMEELNEKVIQNLKKETPVTVEVKTTDAITYSNGYTMNYFNVLGYILLSSLITGVSIVMFSFHGVDIRRRHSASPISNRGMNAQLLLANLIYVFGLLILYIIAGHVLNKDRVFNMNTWLTWINAAVFTITCLSISYLIGITVKSRKAVQALTTAVSLSLSFISGIFVPQQYLGDSVIKAASFTPTFWYVKANNSIYEISALQWSEISKIVGYMAIQLGFAVAIISIALVVSKRKRQQAF